MHHIQALDHRDPYTARQIHALLVSAHAQEVGVLGLTRHVGASRSLEAIRSGSDFHLGAFDGEALVGTTSVGPDDESNQITITSLCVDRAHQRRGIGRSLVADILRRGAGMTFSVSAAANNRAALTLYLGLGFVEYRQGLLGPGQLAMVKLRRHAP